MPKILKTTLKDEIRSFLDKFGIRNAVYKRFSRLKYFLDFPARKANSRFVKLGSPDGLPLPSPYLVHLVNGQFNVESFYHNGYTGMESIKAVLEDKEIDICTKKEILDFGCGCGRVLRHWKRLKGPKIYGCDYNPLLTKWCKESLPFSQIETSGEIPPLPYHNEMVDFIYSIWDKKDLSKGISRVFYGKPFGDRREISGNKLMWVISP